MMLFLTQCGPIQQGIPILQRI